MDVMIEQYNISSTSVEHAKSCLLTKKPYLMRLLVTCSFFCGEFWWAKLAEEAETAGLCH